MPNRLYIVIWGYLHRTRNLKDVGKGQFRGWVCHAKDPECGSEKSLKCLSIMVSGSDLPSRKLLWQHYRDTKNCGIKVDFPLLLLPLLAHLTKTISISGVSNSIEQINSQLKKVPSGHSICARRHPGEESAIIHITHAASTLHARNSQNMLSIATSPDFLFQTNSRLAESELVLCWAL